MSQFTVMPEVASVCMLYGNFQQASVIPVAAANLLGEV